jgi:hypothetical protein
MSMADSEITIEILKDIRDATRGTNVRLDSMEAALTQRLDLVETAILDLAEQNRFIVRYTKALSERHSDVEPRVSALEDRVDKLESK